MGKRLIGPTRGLVRAAVAAVTTLTAVSAVIVGPASAAPRRDSMILHAVPVGKTPRQVPPRPTIEAVSPGNDELILTVEVSEPTSGPTVTSVTAMCGTQSTTVDEADPGEITVTGLTDGQRYRCKAYATNSVGKGPKSKRATGKPAVVVPGVPAITSVAPGNGSFTVDYDASPGFGSTVTGYTATCGSASTTVGGSTLTATVSGLTADGNYSCSLHATDAKGDGPSATWSGLAGPPPAPTITSVLSQVGQLTVQYDLVSDFALSYTATCGTKSATVNGDIDSNFPVPASWATITGLSDGTSYPCSVLATNAAGSGPASTAMAGTPNPISSSPTSSAGGFFVAVSCPTSSECVAVGVGAGTGLVEVSSDGGKTFIDEPVPAGTPQLKAVSCSDAMHCIAVGGSTALVSTDGGAVWNAEFAGWNLSAVGCLSASVCIASGYTPYGSTSMTSDGGTTWQQSTGFQPPLIDLTCTSTATCVGVVAQSPNVAVSSDDGVTWQKFAFLDNGFEVPTSVACPPSTTTCIMVGQNTQGISEPSLPAASFLTTDEGQTWSNISSSFPSGSWTMFDISCPTSATCYAVGNPGSGQADEGAITSNGGQAWTSFVGPTGVESPGETLAGFQSLSCASSSDCVVVGHNSSGPTVALTTNSATSWTQATVG